MRAGLFETYVIFDFIIVAVICFYVVIDQIVDVFYLFFDIFIYRLDQQLKTALQTMTRKSYKKD